MRTSNARLIAQLALAIWTVVVGVALVVMLERTPEHVAAALGSVPTTPPAPASTAPIEVVIDPGTSAVQITQLLERRGVLDDPARFSTLLALTGVGAELQAGRYELPANAPATEVLRRLREGLTAPVLVAVPEGLRLEEVGAIFVERGIFTTEQWEAALAEPYGDAFLAERPEGATLLGYLLPASFPIASQTDASSVVRAMLDHFSEELTPDLLADATARGLSLFDVITLASIVEREAAVSSDQPLIASVLFNRLADGMLLQVDPTVQFAIATPESIATDGWWKRDLTLDDLAIDSPYNTYRYAGLPPGPIANPGIEAIRAVIHAPGTDYYYFVAAPECDGSHRFSTTLAEHEANAAAFATAACAQ